MRRTCSFEPKNPTRCVEENFLQDAASNTYGEGELHVDSSMSHLLLFGDVQQESELEERHKLSDGRCEWVEQSHVFCFVVSKHSCTKLSLIGKVSIHPEIYLKETYKKPGFSFL